MLKNTFLGALVLAAINLAAQYPNILISDVNGPNEPSINLDKRNPNRMMAGCNINKYYYSEDAGLTWTLDYLESPEYGVWGDPVIIADTSGDFYYFHLSNPPDGSWIDRIVCQKFNWETKTWNEGSYMGLNGTKAQDKEWATVDSSTNTIYVTWTQFDDYGNPNPNYFSNIMFSKSTDAGQTWSSAIQINEVPGNCLDGDLTTEGAVPALSPEGTIYVAWAGPAGLVFDRSEDGGETWLEEDIFVDEFPTGWDYDIPGIFRANGLPVTVTDLSGGPHHGTIYINWSDQRNGQDDTDIWLKKSTDGGDTWSELIRINDDPPGKHQFFTWMTVDQITGYLYCIFYDRRNYNDTRTDVYLAVSRDGAQSWENILISEEPFVPSASHFFGDYTNIVAHDDVIRPVWIRLHNDQKSLWTSLMEEPVALLESPITRAGLEQNYPNPFQSSTIVKLKMYKAGAASLKVFNSSGQQVYIVVDNEYLQAGKYEYQIDAVKAGLSSGMYYYVLTAAGMNQQRNMLLIK